MRTALLAVAALALPALASPEIALETRSIPPALLLAEVLPQPAGHPFVRDLVTRQLTDSTIPSACKSVCGSTVQIYEACTGSRTQANRDTCLSVCQQSVFTEYTSCLQCAVDNIQGGFTASELRLLQGAVDDLQETCADEGQTVTAPSLTRGSSTGTVTATRTATATSTVSITYGTFPDLISRMRLDTYADKRTAGPLVL